MIDGSEQGLADLRRLKISLREQHQQWEGPNIEVGDYTYGVPTVLSWNEGAKLKIGKFCSIADNVIIMLGGNHRTDWISTYPFNALMPETFGYIKGHPSTDGDITICNDVWIARDAKIMSGVTIGNGAVIAANAVVTRDVLPYSIVGGVPARKIKNRFSGHDIRRLIGIKWWDWPEADIATVIPLLQNNDFAALWEYAKRKGL